MIIDGKQIAEEIKQELKEEIAKLSQERPPGLAVILVGQISASHLYVNNKIKACQAVGIRSFKTEFPDTITQEELLVEIDRLNQDPAVDGILVQLPLPRHIDPHLVTYRISPDKDVDGFHPFNVGKMLIGEKDGFIPCTALGIQILLERSRIETQGKHILVIGRSNIVGKPTAALLMQNVSSGNATVTVANSYTLDLPFLSRAADIIIAAIGKPLFLTADMVSEGAAVIDVGTNKIEDPSKKCGYSIVGDVDFNHVAPKCSFITPVPGGVGPMTIAMLLRNTLESYKRREIRI